ncbi:hypothetical protein GCM10020331_040890 [Ectobacillus funiculus]
METKYLTVTALTKYIKAKKWNATRICKRFGYKEKFRIFKHHGRGHMYFTLKDAGAKILAVMFAGYNRSLAFMPENGMTVFSQRADFRLRGKRKLSDICAGNAAGWCWEFIFGI